MDEPRLGFCLFSREIDTVNFQEIQVEWQEEYAVVHP